MDLPSRGRACGRALALAFGLLAAACGSDYPATGGGGGAGGGGAGAGKSAGGAGGGPRSVRTVRVAETTVGQSVVVTGTLSPYDQATVTAKVPGRLAALAVDLGSRVKKGQLMARIEAPDYQIRVQQAQAALAEARARVGLGEGEGQRVDPQRTGTVRAAGAVLEAARTSHDRATALSNEGLISKAELDAAEAARRVAESRYQDAIEEIQGRTASAGQRRADVALARQQLADTGIYAPFAGVVQEKRASIGEYLTAGAPVVDLVRVDPLRFRAEVPEREAGSVRVGQELRISAEGQPAVIGRLARLSPTITERNRVLVVEADIPNQGTLRPGVLVRAEIVTNASRTALTVPNDAVISFAGLQKVLLVKDGKALERPIVSGQRSEHWTEVTSGLAAGDQVVLKPGNLQSGQPITVATAQAN
jgi:RND family efflux transporter MFP subunit